MRKTKKRFLSALLACAMIVSLFPFASFADDDIIYVDAASTAASEAGTQAEP